MSTPSYQSIPSRAGARSLAAVARSFAGGVYAFLLFAACSALLLSGCGRDFDADPLVEYSTEVVVRGETPHVISRQLRAGTYLIEIRERDIDLRPSVDTAAGHIELADAYLRHGVHRAVVKLPAAEPVRVTLRSIDQRSWRGAAAVRILRWPASATSGRSDERLLGLTQLALANQRIADDSIESWRAAIAPLDEAAAHFRTAGDLHALAEVEYQRGNVEFNLLLDFEAALRSGEAARAHFVAADDPLAAARTDLLITLAEANLVVKMPEQEQRASFRKIDQRLRRAQAYFDAHDAPSDALATLNLRAMPDIILGQYGPQTALYEEVRARAHARGDKYFEASSTQNLAYIASRSGEMARASEMYETALSLVDRERNPDIFATITANLGYTLIALGDFDRALFLQTEALEVFSARGDHSQTARTLAALGAIQFRTGNLERALESLRNALPLYERSGDTIGMSSTLRLIGNVAAELGDHDLALEYLRRAESGTSNAEIVERTRVLIAGELRSLGDLRRAEQLLESVLTKSSGLTRADALAERARLRQRQRRATDALADLKEADAIYARLQLDFNRIDSSSALALALLARGDVAAAGVAADTAVGIEKRIRVKSANPELRARFLSASYAPYEARIEVDFASAPPGDPEAAWNAFRTAETIRARSLADRLSHVGGAPRASGESERLREKLTALQIELERSARRGESDGARMLEMRRLIDETQARLETRMVSDDAVRPSDLLAIPPGRAEVQAALPADTAVLAYFVGDARSHAWLLTRDSLRHAVMPGRRALQGLVNEFVARQRNGTHSTPDSTFAPLLAGLLDGVKARRLLILPDGPLNGLPFAALPLRRTGGRELLVDRFVPIAVPSLALALRPAEARDTHPTRVAVVSDPVYTPDDRRLSLAASHAANFRGGANGSAAFARLPYSAIEARAVARAFEGAEVIELTGLNATARRVVELPSRELDVLHFATHAVARRDAPEQSALFLSEYAADGSPLPVDRLTADDIARSGLRADVVVLSGCATGDGRELRGEGVLGLTYGFLANGSDTVIASLWPVEDALTARFMEEFYAAYRATGEAADALRVAQLRTRGSVGSAVWSSFVVRANRLP